MTDTRARIFEVGPRDGLQNEETILDVDHKVELIERLVAAGARDVEIGSFVHPKWIPQMADTEAVVARLAESPPATDDPVRYWALVPNKRGLERALEAGVTHIATFLSSSESHNESNLNRTIAQSLECLEESYAIALREGCTVRAYVSTVFGCPYEGPVDFDRVMDIAGRLIDFGAESLSLGDTIGSGTPLQVRDGCRRAIEAFGAERVALHLHDTRGLGLVNSFAAWQAGVRMFDSSAGGLGGCPYAPGAAGNLGTEDLVHMLDSMGVATGIDLDAVVATSRWLEEETGLEPASKYYAYARAARGETAPSVQ